MIVTEKLTKYFNDFLAVDAVNLHVKTGEVLALLGPNGAGKTTTIRMLTTVLRPTTGTARVAGFDVLTNPAQVRSAVGVLTEDHGLYDRMHLVEYLDFFGQIYDMEENDRKTRIQHLLDKFDLLEAKGRQIGKFSKGMRQKLSLARSLLHSPPVLLLDEPTSAMDPASARLVRNAIKTLRSEDRAIIVCTHNLSEAEELADKIAIISQGKIIALGTSSDLKQQLLGPGEYRITFNENLEGKSIPMPDDLNVTGKGSDWIQYQTTSPRAANPLFLKILTKADIDVLKLEEIERSLESVYLQAVNNHPAKEVDGVE